MAEKEALGSRPGSEQAAGQERSGRWIFSKERACLGHTCFLGVFFPFSFAFGRQESRRQKQSLVQRGGGCRDSRAVSEVSLYI